MNEVESIATLETYIPNLADNCPHSLLDLLVALDERLLNSEQEKCSRRKIDFYSFELKERCKDLDAAAKLSVLREYMFTQKRFKAGPVIAEKTEDLSFRCLMSSKQSSAISLSLLFMSLAAQIDIKVYLVNLSPYSIIKWVDQGHAYYFDVSRQGQKIEEKLALEILQDKQLSDKGCSLEALNYVQVFQLFLKQLSKILNAQKRWQDLKLVLDLSLTIDPHQFHVLGQRALTNKRLGYLKESLCDIKRYLSFTNLNECSPEIRIAYHELSGGN